MSNIWKRALSMFLAVVMVLGNVPLQAFATETEPHVHETEAVETTAAAVTEAPVVTTEAPETTAPATTAAPETTVPATTEAVVETTVETEPVPTLSGEVRTLYALNVAAWEEVWVGYSFDEEYFADVTKPGVELEYVEEQDVWTVQIPVEADAVLFNDGIDHTNDEPLPEGVEPPVYEIEVILDTDTYYDFYIGDEEDPWINYAAWLEAQQLDEPAETESVTPTETEAADDIIVEEEEVVEGEAITGEVGMASAVVGSDLEILDGKITESELAGYISGSSGGTRYSIDGGSTTTMNFSGWGTTNDTIDFTQHHGKTIKLEKYTSTGFLQGNWNTSVSYTIKVYHNVTATLATDSDANATGGGVTVANNGKVYHNEQATITVTDVDGYRAEVYNASGTKVADLSDDAGWSYQPTVTASTSYTVKYVSAVATKYDVTLNVVNGEYGSASLAKSTGIANEEIALTIVENDSTAQAVTSNVTVTGTGASYANGKVKVGTSAVTVTVTFTANTLSKAESIQSVPYNGYVDANGTALGAAAQMAGKSAYADVANKLSLEQAIINALGIQYNGKPVSVSEVTIQYYPWNDAQYTADSYLKDSVRTLDVAAPGDDTDLNNNIRYDFGERFASGGKEMILVTHKATGLSIETEITLTEGRLIAAVDASSVTEKGEYEANDQTALETAVKGDIQVTSGATATYEFTGTFPTVADTPSEYSVTATVADDTTWVGASDTAAFTVTVNTYTITWNADNAEGDADVTTQTLPYGAEYNAPTAPTKKGHTFKGWKNETTGATATDITATVSGDVTYTAQWEVQSYTLTWKYMDGEDQLNTASSTVAFDTELSIPTGYTPTQEGYTFDQWIPAEGAPTTMPDQDTTIVLNASWTINTYTITFVNADGTELDEVTVNYNETPAYNGETPTKAGNAQYSYTFAGWSPALAPATADITYRATYTETVNKYTITWVDEDGTVLETDENVEYGATPTFDGEKPTKDSDDASVTYVFSGWTPAIDSVTGDETYTATYTTKAVYDVHGVVGNGNIMESTAIDGEDFTMQDAEWGIHDFKGWYTAAEGGTKVTFPTKITEETTYYAQWDKYYTVSFAETGDTTMESLVKAENSVIYASNVAEPSRNGYQFNGWTIAGEAAQFPLTVTGDVTLTAQWLKEYTLTINYNGNGTETSTTTIVEGEEVSKPGDPTWEGHVFMGWNGWTFEGNSGTVSGNISLLAQWELDTNGNGVADNTETKYTVTYTGEGITEQKTTGLLTLTDIPTYTSSTARTNYIFTGWLSSLDGKVYQTAEITGKIGESDITYTAQWQDDFNNNKVNDATETVKVTVTGNGSVAIKQGETVVATFTKDSEVKTYLYNSNSNSYTIVATPTNWSSEYNYVASVYNNNTTNIATNVSNYADGTFTSPAISLGETLTVAFEQRVLDVNGNTVYVNGYNATNIKAGYTSELVPAAFVDYEASSGYDIANASLSVQVKHREWFGNEWSAPNSLPDMGALGTSYDAPPTTKTIRVIWSGDAHYPQVTSAEVTATIKDSRDPASVTFGEIAEVTVTGSLDPVVEAAKNAATTNGGALTASVKSGTLPTPENPTSQIVVTVSAAADADALTGSNTVTVTAKLASYTVTWKDGDGKVIETDSTVYYGATPEYNGATPTKQQTETTVYTWNNGWTPAVEAATANVEYTAIFDEAPRKYVILWDTDGDGTYETETQADWNTIPTAPTVTVPENQSLEWEPKLVAVSGEGHKYKATFTNDDVYTINFIANGVTFNTQTINTTKNPTATVADPGNPDADNKIPNQVFDGWDKTVIGITPSGTERTITVTAILKDDVNDNGIADENETATVRVNVTGNGTVALSAIDTVKIKDNGDGTYTVVYNSATGVENGNVVKVTATSNDTDGTDGSITYLISEAEQSVTVNDGETKTVNVEFGTHSMNVAETGDVFINGATSEALNKLKGLKDKVLTAAFGAGNYDASEYTVYMVTGNGNYDIENSSSLQQADMLARFNVGDNQSFIVKKNTTPAISDTISISVKDSRKTLAITAENVIISAKTEPADVLDQVKRAISIKETNPQTGVTSDVEVIDSYLSWNKDYAWPADAETATFTVTVRVNTVANETYSNAPSAKLTLTCTDTTILYKVTYLDGYNAEGENVVAEYTIAENLATTKPADPTREYYTFAGWTPAVAATATADATYTATWTADVDVNGNGTADQEETYTIIYKDGYNEEGKDVLETFEDQAWGIATPSIEEPERADYNFKGWDPAPAATISAPSEGNTITYTAQWTQLYAVIFMSNEEQYTTDEVKAGEPVAEPDVPVWDEDHDFLGWYNGDAKYDFTTPVTGNLTLTAKWRDDFNHNDIADENEAHYDVIYDVDGVQTKYEKVLVGVATPAYGETDPVKEGYVFSTWTPEVAETVTKNVTYKVVWANDINGNKVDDAQETITITANKANDADTIAVTGAVAAAEANTYVYDSTGDKTVTIEATPVVNNGKSVTYVQKIADGGEYDSNFVYTYSFTAENGQEIAVNFAVAELTLNETRIMNYHEFMTEVKNEDVYNAIVDTPEYAEATQYTIQYKAREAMSQTVQLSSLGLPDTVLRVLELLKITDFTFDMPDLWLDVNVETEGQVKESVSLDQAVSQYLTTERITGLWDIYNDNGGLLGGGVDAVKAEIEEIYENVYEAAMYYGAHNFGYNATGAETVTEEIKITYKNAAMYVECETDITLKDMRAASKLVASDVSLMYRDYTDEELAAAIGAYVTDENGTKIEGAEITCLDITDPYTYEGKYVSDTAYELVFKFKGNADYKPSEKTVQVTITKAPASIDLPNVMATYGEAYNHAPSVTLGNKYGEASEVTDSLIQFIIGLDIADIDINGDGVTGLNGQVQLILPADLQSMLDGLLGLTGGDTSEGMEMTLSQLLSYLETINDESLASLKQILETLQGITEVGDITIKVGGDYPTDVGAYLYGAVSTSTNYETAYDVGYIIIKPDATRVYLDFNYNDTNGIFTPALLQHVDLGASAFDEEALVNKNEDASALINNLFFGFDINGELVAKLYNKDIEDLETIENELDNGAYTQMAFIAEFGNEMYYAVPIVRAFVIIPNVVEVVFLDETGAENGDRKFVFNNTPQGMDAVKIIDTANGIEKVLDADDESLTLTYTGIQTNTKTYSDSNPPVHAGAYAVTALYVEKDENGKIVRVGVGLGAVAIEPSESTIDVTNAVKVYDGNPYNTADMINAESVNAPGLEPDTTVITAMISTDGTFSENALEAVTGTVNVDFPKWLDEILSEEFPGAYDENGVNAKDFVNKLNEYTAQLLELGVPETMIAELVGLFNSLPEDVTLTFNDQAMVQPTNVGVYLVMGVVTDSDHYPSVDMGILVITPDATEAVLKYLDGDENGIYMVETLKMVDLGATAFVDGVENDEATALVNNIFVGVNINGDLVTETDQTKLLPGEYVEFSYILDVDSKMYYAVPISRLITVSANLYDVQIHDASGTKNHDRKFTYNGEPHEIGEIVVFDQNGEKIVIGEEDELTITYYGIDGAVQGYKSTTPPTNAGAYLAMVTYVDYDAEGSCIGVGVTAGAMVIEQMEAELTVHDTTVTYNGKEQFPLVTIEGPNGPVETDYIAVVVDPDTMEYNLILEDDANRALELIEKILNREIPDQMEVSELLAMVKEAMELVRKVQYSDELQTVIDLLPEDVQTRVNSVIAEQVDPLLTQLESYLNSVPADMDLGTVFINGTKPINVGSYQVYAIAISGNYKAAMTEEPGILTINPAKIWIETNSAEKYFGMDDPDFTYSEIKYYTSDANNNDQVDPEEEITGISTELGINLYRRDLDEDGVPDGQLAGGTGEDYFIRADVTVDDPNFVVGRVVWGSLTIHKAQIEIVMDDQEVYYGLTYPSGDALTYTAAAVEGKGAIVEEIAVPVIETEITLDPGADVGTYEGVITCATSVDGDPNYELVDVTPGNLTILPAEITITAESASKVYGENDPKLEYTVTVDTDENGNPKGPYSNDLSGELSRVEGEDAGEYAITQGTLSNENYSITFNGATFTIKPKPIARGNISVQNEQVRLFYNGTEQTQKVIITVDGVVLEEGKDYILSGNTGIGNAATRTSYTTLGVEGIGNYTGTFKNIAWTIYPCEHTIEADAVVENRVEPTCSVAGSYDEVVYCTIEGCGKELSRETKTIEKLAHTAGEAVIENKVEVTCEVEGSYDEVVYCTECDEELNRETKTIEKLAHTEGAAVIENKVEATCEAEGSYDEVVYCTECGEELSRETKTIEKLAHTEGEAVIENKVDATCEVAGSYDEVVYCAECGEELSRETKTIEKLAHTKGEAVIENKVEATCEAEGSYEEVIYCSVCDEELSRKTVVVDKTGHKQTFYSKVDATCTAAGKEAGAICSVCGDVVGMEEIPAKGHTPADAVTENEVKATCTKDGSYDTVVYCSVCDEEISRETTIVPATGHTAGDAVIEKEVKATCTKPGSYDTVVYCSVCDAEISRETTVVPAIGHTPGKPVEENRIEPTQTVDGSYELVVYCEVCGEELSRTTYVIKAEGQIEIKKVHVELDDTVLIYDATEQTQELVVTVDGKVLKEGVDYDVINNEGTNAGEYTLTVVGKGDYTGKVELPWNIEKAEVTVTAQDASKTYGDKDPEYTAEVEGLKGKDTLDITFTREEGENAGEYEITAKAEDSNYIIDVVPGKLTVAQKAVTIILDDKTIYFDHKLPEWTYEVTAGELVEGDELKVEINCKLRTTPILDYTDVMNPVDGEAYARDKYTITAGDQDPNYEITVIDGTLNIEKVPSVPMYRMYNPNSGEHHYTGSEEERDNLVNVGWNYEGVAWNAPVYIGEAMHRVHNPNSGDHHYSASEEEIANLVSLGWQYEGVAWNSAPPSDDEGFRTDSPQFRMYNPNTETGLGSHHYTGSWEEVEWLVSLGWNYEGISWYSLLY